MVLGCRSRRRLRHHSTRVEPDGRLPPRWGECQGRHGSTATEAAGLAQRHGKRDHDPSAQTEPPDLAMRQVGLAMLSI